MLTRITHDTWENPEEFRLKLHKDTSNITVHAPDGEHLETFSNIKEAINYMDRMSIALLEVNARY